MLIQPATGREPGTHVGTASTTDPDIGDGKLKVKVRFVAARFVTASLVPAQTMMMVEVRKRDVRLMGRKYVGLDGGRHVAVRCSSRLRDLRGGSCV